MFTWFLIFLVVCVIAAAGANYTRRWEQSLFVWNCHGRHRIICTGLAYEKAKKTGSTVQRPNGQTFVVVSHDCMWQPNDLALATTGVPDLFVPRVNTLISPDDQRVLFRTPESNAESWMRKMWWKTLLLHPIFMLKRWISLTLTLVATLAGLLCVGTAFVGVFTIIDESEGRTPMTITRTSPGDESARVEAVLRGDLRQELFFDGTTPILVQGLAHKTATIGGGLTLVCVGSQTYSNCGIGYGHFEQGQLVRMRSGELANFGDEIGYSKEQQMWVISEKEYVLLAASDRFYLIDHLNPK